MHWVGVGYLGMGDSEGVGRNEGVGDCGYVGVCIIVEWYGVGDDGVCCKPMARFSHFYLCLYNKPT